jgi:transcriptional regulator with GAF, ATPase, and Fis domain
MPNTEEYINKMYDASLESEKAGLKQNYEQDTANLAAEQEKARKQSDANLARTYVEAAKAQKNYNEVENAYGLTSGAMAQARLSRDNQLQGDLTAIRTAQQDIDAGIERERSILAQQYSAAIQQAQANNDLQRAQALFEAAQAEEERLNRQKANAANLMAGVGDYARLAELYGLTEEELRRLMGRGSSYAPLASNASGASGTGSSYSPGRNYTEAAFGE